MESWSSMLFRSVIVLLFSSSETSSMISLISYSEASITSVFAACSSLLPSSTVTDPAIGLGTLGLWVDFLFCFVSDCSLSWSYNPCISTMNLSRVLFVCSAVSSFSFCYCFSNAWRSYFSWSNFSSRALSEDYVLFKHYSNIDYSLLPSVLSDYDCTTTRDSFGSSFM